MENDRQKLIKLRVSVFRIAIEMGLESELPIEQITKLAEKDEGWNTRCSDIIDQSKYLMEIR